MKIAIITHLPINPKENEMLLEAAKDKTGDGVLIDIDDLILGTTNNAPFVKWANGNFLDYDVYLIRDIWHAMKKAIIIINWLKWNNKVVIDNNLAEVQYTINKIRTFFELAQAGLQVPRTFYPQSKAHFQKYVEEAGYPVVIKSNSAGKGAYVYKCDDEATVKDLIKQIEKSGHKYEKYLIQEYIPYKRDLRIFVLGGEAVAAMHRIPKPGNFAANYSKGGSVEVTELTPTIKEIAEKAAKAAKAEFGGVDLLETDRGEYYALEVNRTPGFDGISKATGEDFGEKVIEYCIKVYNQSSGQK